MPALDSNGNPLSGAKWKFYLTGTSTPASVYSDADLTRPLGSSVTASASGQFVPIYYDDKTALRAVLETSGGSPRQDIDPINDPGVEVQETNSSNDTFTTRLGGDADNGDVLYWHHSDDTAGWAWRLRRIGGDWVVDNANNDFRRAFVLTGELTARFMGTTVTQPYIFNAPIIAVGDGVNARRRTTGTAAPTTGAWAQGDIVWNLNASASGKIGWVCVTAGTPGTWKTFGAIDA